MKDEIIRHTCFYANGHILMRPVRCFDRLSDGAIFWRIKAVILRSDNVVGTCSFHRKRLQLLNFECNMIIIRTDLSKKRGGMKENESYWYLGEI